MLLLSNVAEFCSTNRFGRARVAASTVKTYRNAASKLIAFFGDVDVTQIREMDLLDWQEWLDAQGIRNATNNMYKRTVRALFNVMREREVPVANPMGLFVFRKEVRGVRSTKESQYNLLMSYSGLRDALIVEWCWSAGPRRSDLVTMRVPDIDIEFDKQTMQFRVLARVWRETKGKKERVIPGGHQVGLLLTAWLTVREHLLADLSKKHDHLFVSLSDKALGEPMSADAVTQLFRRLREKAGLKKAKNVSPHKMRHAFAKRALNSGMPITAVQNLLGHECEETTMKYAIYGEDESVDLYFDLFGIGD